MAPPQQNTWVSSNASSRRSSGEHEAPASAHPLGRTVDHADFPAGPRPQATAHGTVHAAMVLKVWRRQRHTQPGCCPCCRLCWRRREKFGKCHGRPLDGVPASFVLAMELLLASNRHYRQYGRQNSLGFLWSRAGKMSAVKFVVKSTRGSLFSPCVGSFVCVCSAPCSLVPS